jgi:hypothetical protein
MYNPLSAEFAIQPAVNTSNTYASRFRITRTTTTELKNPAILEQYKRAGFLYIRKLHYNYNKIAREPTVGSYVELSFLPEVDSLPIDSWRATKFINRLSYF